VEGEGLEEVIDGVLGEGGEEVREGGREGVRKGLLTPSETAWCMKRMIWCLLVEGV